ncbi:MAG: hypothetical protein RL069_2064 [Planctomycetota bacterium]|jgi:hypothetical protein
MGVGNPFISNAYGGNYTGNFILVNRKWGLGSMNVLGNSRKTFVADGVDDGLGEGIEPKNGLYWGFMPLSFRAGSFSAIDHISGWDRQKIGSNQ